MNLRRNIVLETKRGRCVYQLIHMVSNYMLYINEIEHMNNVVLKASSVVCVCLMCRFLTSDRVPSTGDI